MINSLVVSPIITTTAGNYDILCVNNVISDNTGNFQLTTDNLNNISVDINDAYSAFKIYNVQFFTETIYNTNPDTDEIDFLRYKVNKKSPNISTDNFNAQLLLNSFIQSLFISNLNEYYEFKPDKLMLNFKFNIFQKAFNTTTNLWYINDTSGYLAYDCLYAAKTPTVQKPMLLNKTTTLTDDYYKLDDYYLNDDKTKNNLLFSLILNRFPFNSEEFNVSIEIFDKNGSRYFDKFISFPTFNLESNSAYFTFNPFYTDLELKEGYCLMYMNDYTNSVYLTYRFDIKNVCTKYNKYKLHYVDYDAAYSQLQFSYKSTKNIDITKSDFLKLNTNNKTYYNSSYYNILTLTSNFINEGDNQKFKELLTSKFVYLENPDGSVEPVVIISDNLNLSNYKQEKRNLNYEITVKKSNNIKRQTI